MKHGFGEAEEGVATGGILDIGVCVGGLNYLDQTGMVGETGALVRGWWWGSRGEGRGGGARLSWRDEGSTSFRAIIGRRHESKCVPAGRNQGSEGR